jgi:hypothetical protein
MHYYFKLNENQMEELDTFMSSTALCFTTSKQQRNIDIKYTNQVFFGPSYLSYGDEIHRYEIDNDTSPVILPEYLFNEILRVHKIQNGSNKKISIKKIKDDKEKIKKTKDIVVIQDDEEKIKGDSDMIDRLKIYLKCINPKRFDDREDWLRIGAIIYNENAPYELFDEYSKLSHKYDSSECKKLWNSFKSDHAKKAKLKHLIELAEIDAEKNKDLYITAIIKDKIGILEFLFNNGPSDLYMSYLFHNLTMGQFIFDTLNDTWYCINSYGIYISDKRGDTVKRQIDSHMLSIFKKEYIRQLNLITNEYDVNSSKILFNKYQKLNKYCTSNTNTDNLLSKIRLLCTDDKVYEKMDTINPNLIGFDNGVYDLESNTFRNAKAEEFISVTTGYKYQKADIKLKKEAMNLLKSIFDDEEELKFVLKHISLGLYGGNPEEKFYIWMGSGSNAKGLLRDIIKLVLGEYYDTMDITYLYKTNIIRADGANPVM